jgi:hypothetical protein
MTNHDERAAHDTEAPTTPYRAPADVDAHRAAPAAVQPAQPVTVQPGAAQPGPVQPAAAWGAQPAAAWGSERRDGEVVVRTMTEYRAPGWANVPATMGPVPPHAGGTAWNAAPAWNATPPRKPRAPWFWPVVVSGAAVVALFGGGGVGYAIGHSIGGGTSQSTQGGTTQGGTTQGGTKGGTGQFPGGTNGGTNGGTGQFPGGTGGTGTGNGFGTGGGTGTSQSS